MKDLIARLANHLGAAGVSLKLRVGNDDAALDAAEEELGVALTPSLRALLRVANGQGGVPQYEPGAVHLFPSDMRLFSLKKLLAEHAAQSSYASEEGYDALAVG